MKGRCGKETSSRKTSATQWTSVARIGLREGKLRWGDRGFAWIQRDFGRWGFKRCKTMSKTLDKYMGENTLSTRAMGKGERKEVSER
jgi:hypothetical protein